MINRQHFKKAIKSYYHKKSLSEAQQSALETLQKDLKKPEQKQSLESYKWLSTIAASLLLFAVAFTYSQTPNIIASAYADTLKDAEMNNGMQPLMTQWMDENKLNVIPQQFKVEMARFCKLDKYLTTHLRIAGVEQGELHLFFHRGEQPLSWFNRTGTFEKMNWKLLKIRDDLTVVAMYTHDMREKSVQVILENILPEYSA